jgi:hypothetical protein
MGGYYEHVRPDPSSQSRDDETTIRLYSLGHHCHSGDRGIRRGLFIANLDRDNAFVTTVWRGNDLVTLVVAVPLMVATLILTLR